VEWILPSSSLAARRRTERSRSHISNKQTEGIAGLAAFCHNHDVELVAMEATGGLRTAGFRAAFRIGLSGHHRQPAGGAQFAPEHGSAGKKTDSIDAGMIAWYAGDQEIPASVPAPQTQLELRARVTRLRQLTELRTTQLNQQRLVTNRAVQAGFRKMLGLCGQTDPGTGKSIAALIDADPLWRELDQAFRTIKGVADRTVARIMAEMPEIGTLSNKTISKLAGVAPLAQDSGKHQGKRAVRGGRAAVREILFIVASVVGRHEPDFVAFQKRLRDAGKPPKVIRIALAHKLLVRLNAKAREVRQRLAILRSEPRPPLLAAY